MKQTFTYETEPRFSRRPHQLLTNTAVHHPPDPQWIAFF